MKNCLKMKGRIVSFCFLIVIINVPASNGIKCYICNTEFPGIDVTDETCRHPNKRLDFKPKECTEKVLLELMNTWTNGEWVWNNLHGGSNIHLDNRKWTRQAKSDFGFQKREGHELKCVKEVLHYTSRPWFEDKPSNFSQITRYCEYKPKRENCEKPCTDIQILEGECYVCCDSNGCNTGRNVAPSSLVIGLLVTFAVVRTTFAKNSLYLNSHSMLLKLNASLL